MVIPKIYMLIGLTCCLFAIHTGVTFPPINYELSYCCTYFFPFNSYLIVIDVIFDPELLSVAFDIDHYSNLHRIGNYLQSFLSVVSVISDPESVLYFR